MCVCFLSCFGDDKKEKKNFENVVLPIEYIKKNLKRNPKRNN